MTKAWREFEGRSSHLENRYRALACRFGKFAARVMFIAIVSVAAPPAIAQSQTDGAYLNWHDGMLSAGNRHLQRTWDLADGWPRARSLVAGGREWLIQTPVDREDLFRRHAHLRRGSAEANVDSPPTLTLPGAVALQSPITTTWTASFGQAHPVEAASWHGALTVLGADDQGYRWHVKVFPNAAAILCRVERVGSETPAATAGSAATTAARATGIEAAAPAAVTFPNDDLLEDLLLAPEHATLTVVELADQTDSRNTLAHERVWPLHPGETITARTNLIAVDDVLSEAGLAVLKFDALPDARAMATPQDVRATYRTVRVYGHGAGEPGQGCWWAVLGYRGHRWERAAALHALQAQLRTYSTPEMLSNTWGDRNRDARVNASFVAAEIDRGAELGVDVCQIDDGWQKGVSSNSAQRGGIWGEGFWAADPEFWTPRLGVFPQGLEPLMTQARVRGLRLGLWFHPDASDHYAQWARDAHVVLGLYRSHGIRHLKIDGVEIRSKAGQLNYERFIDRVLEESHGEVIFDLDVTAGRRPAYFGLIRAGPIFLENRYTDWHNWWPHATLRNLWQLSWYVPPQRFRIEFLNPRRHTDLYRGDLLAPAAYAADYPCAVTLVANPLAWFEVSSLPDDVFQPVQALVKIWKRHRDELHRGRVLPIGDCPSGAAWTGFCSVNDDADVRHVLVFREQTPTLEVALALPSTDGVWTVERLAGSGHAEWENGGLHISDLPSLHYGWFRLTRKK